jgi:hypothetical protein
MRYDRTPIAFVEPPGIFQFRPTLSVSLLFHIIPIDSSSVDCWWTTSELFHAHMRGQSAVMHMRGCNPSSFAVGRSLFANTNRVLTWRDILDRKRPYQALTDWPASMYASPLADTSARLATQIADICGRTREVIEAKSHERDGAWTQNLGAVVRDALNHIGALRQQIWVFCHFLFHVAVLVTVEGVSQFSVWRKIVDLTIPFLDSMKDYPSNLHGSSLASYFNETLEALYGKIPKSTAEHADLTPYFDVFANPNNTIQSKLEAGYNITAAGVVFVCKTLVWSCRDILQRRAKRIHRSYSSGSMILTPSYTSTSLHLPA